MMKMKQVLILCSACAALLLPSCSESVSKNSRFSVALHANYIHPTQNEFQFLSAAGGTMEFSVISQDTPWQIGNLPDWVSVSPVSGSASASLTLSVSAYTRAAPRTAIFTLSSASADWEYSKQMFVSQSGTAPYAEIDKLDFSFGGEAGSVSVPARSNFDWSFSNRGNNWITVAQGDSQMTVSVIANDTGADRSGSVDILFNFAVIATVTVTQLAAEASLRTDPLAFEIGAGSYALAIDSEAPWEAYTYYDWIEISPKSGQAGRTEVAVTVTPNPYDGSRDGYIYFRFKNSGLQIAEIPVHQDGIVMELTESRESLENLTSLGGDFNWYLRSNTDWNIVEVPSFLSVSPMSGSGSTHLSVTIRENATFDWLSGDFIIERIGTGYRTQYWMQQRGRTYDFSGTWLACNDLAQDLYVDVRTEAEWGLDTEAEFFTPSPMSGRGDRRITFSVSENTDYSSRQGVAHFLLYGISGHENGIARVADIYVNQRGWEDKYHELGGTVSLSASGGTIPVDIATNDGWTAAFVTDASWIKMDGAADGKGAGSFRVACETNPSTEARSVRIRVSFEHLDAVEFTLVQSGRAIRPGGDAVYFFAKGGSTTVHVDADGFYSVSKTGDWFTLDVNEDDSFTVRAEPYSGEAERRGSIVLSLTGLAAGAYSITLPVIQTTAAGFTREGFETDRDLNVGAGSGISIRVGSYTTDRNWSGGGRASIGGEGYGDDENWN